MTVKTKPWEEVRANLPNTAKFQATVESERRQALAEIIEYNLAELRRMRQVTQAELARQLGVAQPSLSALERRADVQVSTLREYVEGLGGYLELSAVFDDVRVPLSLLEPVKTD
ncbi:MAG: XRE family transcriptional regulator [Actinomycetota bacterium]|jgi:DNA-binding XRE family transcriptional regulator|nr:XRE family transcriptional regulator [Actinomycetota bacterium]